MYGFRYHLVTVISIFMALGIGILLGSSGQDLLAKEQVDLLNRLEQKYTASRAENSKWSQRVTDLSRQAEQFDRFIGQMGDRNVQGKLAGKKILLLHAEHEDWLPVQIFLQKAGGQVEPVVGVQDAGNDSNNESVRNLVGRLVEKRPDAVVIIGGSAKNGVTRTPQVDVPLIRELRKRNMRIIGAEKSDTDPSVIPAFRNIKIPTVDNLDQATGMWSIVELINGKNGHYGIKQTADALFPLTEEVPVATEMEVK